MKIYLIFLLASEIAAFNNEVIHSVIKRNTDLNKGAQRTIVYKETAKSTYDDGREVKAATFIEGVPDGRVRAVQFSSDPKHGTRAITTWQGEKDNNNAAFIESKPDGHVRLIHYVADPSTEAKIVELDEQESEPTKIEEDNHELHSNNDDNENNSDDTDDQDLSSSLRTMFNMDDDDDESDYMKSFPSHLDEKLSAFNFIFHPSSSSQVPKYVEHDRFYEALAESIQREHNRLYPYFYGESSHKTLAQIYPSIYDRLYMYPSRSSPDNEQSKAETVQTIPMTSSGGMYFPVARSNTVQQEEPVKNSDNEGEKEESTSGEERAAASVLTSEQKQKEYQHITNDINKFLKQIRVWLNLK